MQKHLFFFICSVLVHIQTKENVMVGMQCSFQSTCPGAQSFIFLWLVSWYQSCEPLRSRVQYGKQQTLMISPPLHKHRGGGSIDLCLLTLVTPHFLWSSLRCWHPSCLCLLDCHSLTRRGCWWAADSETPSAAWRGTGGLLLHPCWQGWGQWVKRAARGPYSPDRLGKSNRPLNWRANRSRKGSLVFK